MKRTYSVRMLLILVVISSIASALATKFLYPRRQYFQTQVRFHADHESYEQQQISIYNNIKPEQINPDGPSISRLTDASRRRIEWHSRLASEYRLAADQPWRSEPISGPDPGNDIVWEECTKLPNTTPLADTNDWPGWFVWKS